MALTPGRQRAYNIFFTAAKQSETRISRIEKYKKQHNCKEIYICHYCIDYITDNKSDMKKHFQRKKKSRN